MGPNSNTKTPETHNLDVFKLFWKEEEMLRHGKHAPVPTILSPVAGWFSNLKWANFVHKMLKFLSLNICYVICVLCDLKFF